MSALYPDAPAWLRISDAPFIHAGVGGDKNSGDQRKRCFPWTRRLLQAAARARDTGASWETIRERLVEKTGEEVSSDAVANRVVRFTEDDE